MLQKYNPYQREGYSPLVPPMGVMGLLYGPLQGRGEEEWGGYPPWRYILIKVV